MLALTERDEAKSEASSLENYPSEILSRVADMKAPSRTLLATPSCRKAIRGWAVSAPEKCDDWYSEASSQLGGKVQGWSCSLVYMQHAIAPPNGSLNSRTPVERAIKSRILVAKPANEN